MRKRHWKKNNTKGMTAIMRSEGKTREELYDWFKAAGYIGLSRAEQREVAKRKIEIHEKYNKGETV